MKSGSGAKLFGSATLVLTLIIVGDPLDPLEGGAEEEGEHIEMEGIPEAVPVDESTNGFLDEVRVVFYR